MRRREATKKAQTAHKTQRKEKKRTRRNKTEIDGREEKRREAVKSKAKDVVLAPPLLPSSFSTKQRSKPQQQLWLGGRRHSHRRGAKSEQAGRILARQGRGRRGKAASPRVATRTREPKQRDETPNIHPAKQNESKYEGQTKQKERKRNQDLTAQAARLRQPHQARELTITHLPRINSTHTPCSA